MLSVYWQILLTSIYRQASFKLANISGLFTNTFFMLFRAAVLTTLIGNGKIANYTIAEAMTYVVLIQSLIMVVPQWGKIGVAEDIRTGQIAMDLLRPYNYYFATLSKRLGFCFFYIPIRGIPAILIGYILDYFQLVSGLLDSFLALFSVLISIWIANTMFFLVELTGFWLESPQGPVRLLSALSYFFSGAIIPVAFFPDKLKIVTYLLPFAYTLNAPIEIYLGTTSAIDTILYQIFWAISLALVALWLLKIGEKKLVIQGG